MANVQIYTTSSCAYCKMAKDYFDSLGVQYEEFDVATNVEKRQEMVEKSGQMGVPVIVVNGEIVLGFDRPKIDEALKKVS